MDKCVGCLYYDRQLNSQPDSRGISWGQCRRTAPMLHPVNQKSFMIEGVWPHVRDDDWCGEFKAAAARRAEARPAEAFTPGPLLPISAGGSFGQRPAKVSPLAANSSGAPREVTPSIGAPREVPSSLGSLMSTGRGGD